MNTKQVRNEAERPVRKQRKRFNSLALKLDVPIKIEGYKLHWFNDVDTRIVRASQAGYEFVAPGEVGIESEDSQVKRVVGKKDDGSPLTAFLMKIRQEWWDEDRAEESAHSRQFEEAIRRGKPPIDGASLTNSYIPSTGISLTRE